METSVTSTEPHFWLQSAVRRRRNASADTLSTRLENRSLRPTRACYTSEQNGAYLVDLCEEGSGACGLCRLSAGVLELGEVLGRHLGGRGRGRGPTGRGRGRRRTATRSRGSCGGCRGRASRRDVRRPTLQATKKTRAGWVACVGSYAMHARRQTT